MVEINDYKELIKTIGSHENCFIKIGAPWCNPCKLVQKNIESIEKFYPDIYFISVDVDLADDKIIESFNVRSVPVTIRTMNGEIISKETGLQTVAQIEDRLV